MATRCCMPPGIARGNKQANFSTTGPGVGQCPPLSSFAIPFISRPNSMFRWAVRQGKELCKILRHNAAVLVTVFPLIQDFSVSFKKPATDVEHQWSYRIRLLTHNTQEFCGLDTEADILKRTRVLGGEAGI